MRGRGEGGAVFVCGAAECERGLHDRVAGGLQACSERELAPAKCARARDLPGSTGLDSGAKPDIGKTGRQVVR